jgi:hypothetical protein
VGVPSDSTGRARVHRMERPMSNPFHESDEQRAAYERAARVPPRDAAAPVVAAAAPSPPTRPEVAVAAPAAMPPPPPPVPDAPGRRDGRGRFTGDVTGDRMARARAARKGTHGPTLFKHFKIDQGLSPELRVEYERLARDPNLTLPELRAWLAGHGVVVSRQTVGKHRTHQLLDARRLQECAEMAGAFVELTRAYGPGTVAEASAAKFEMNLMQSMFGMAAPGTETVTPAELTAQAKFARAALENRQRVEAMREDLERRAKVAAEEAERLTRRGASGPAVVARMREILGIAPDDPVA